MTFVIKHEQFEGPLETLLKLIEKRKLFVSDFSLVEITNEYLTLVEAEKRNLNKDSEFLVVAATLVLIKSKSLLPTIDLSDDEQGSIDDLKERLNAFRFLKTLTPSIENQYFSRPLFLPKRVRKQERAFNPGDKLTQRVVLSSIRNQIRDLPQFKAGPHARIRPTISLDQVVKRLTDRIKQSLSLTFSNFSGNKKDRVSAVVDFLAVLELVKQDVISVEQVESYGDITMQTKALEVPRYN